MCGTEEPGRYISILRDRSLLTERIRARSKKDGSKRKLSYSSSVRKAPCANARISSVGRDSREAQDAARSDSGDSCPDRGRRDQKKPSVPLSQAQSGGRE
eukprot:884710-Rhodomonas_salina.2